jgi:hypothetical protein
MPRSEFRLRIPSAMSALVSRRLRPVAQSLGVPLETVKLDLQEILLGYLNVGRLPPDATRVGSDFEFGEIIAFAFGGVQIGFCILLETSEAIIVAVDDP